MNIGTALDQLSRVDGEGLTVPAGATPIDFLCAVYRDARQPMHRRLKAAIEAAPYVHPQLKAQAIVMAGGDFAARLERAIERSNPKLIEAKPVHEAGQHPAGELQAPPAPHDRRFRRL
jgi:hypothetical protein